MRSSIATIETFRAPFIPVWATNLLLTALLMGLWPLNSFMVQYIDNYVVLILCYIGINIILATSLNLIIGVTGQFSLGHAAFMAIGAYGTGILLRHYRIYEPAEGVISLVHMARVVGVLACGGALAALGALLVGIPALRLRGDYLAIATLGFGQIIHNLIVTTQKIGPFHLGRWTIGPFDVGGSAGLHGISIFRNTKFFWIFAGVIVCIVTVWRLVYSTKGKAFLAVREDEVAAAAMGVNTTFYKITAFAIGAFFAGVAGGLSAVVTGNLDPTSYEFMRSIEIVVMVVLGGSGSISGALLAAVLLTYLPEGLRFLKNIHVGSFSGESLPVNQLRWIIYSLLLILMMLLRPGGLLGRRELWFTRRRLAPAERSGLPIEVPPSNPPVG